MELSSLLPDPTEFPPRRKYLVGVSGGCDSMLLLHALSQAGYKRLVICHLDHQLRGAASLGDSRLVRSTARKLGFKFHTAKSNIAKLAASNKQSIETAARAARLDFFAQCARQERCYEIFLAHHADDQAETVLMNLLRGSGLRGLGGMKAVSAHQHPDLKRPLRLIRPMLGIWRAEIRTLAQEHGVAFNEDASNESTEHVRNRLRHELLPMAERVMGRSVREPLVRLAVVAQAEEDFLRSATAKFPLADSLPTADLLKLPLALQRRVLKVWLKFHAVANVNFEVIERIREILPPDGPSAKCNLPQGRHARRRAGKLFLDGVP